MTQSPLSASPPVPQDALAAIDQATPPLQEPIPPPIGQGAPHPADVGAQQGGRRDPADLLAQTLAAMEGLPGEAQENAPAEGGDQVRLLWMAQRIGERQSSTLAHLNTMLWSIGVFRWIGWVLLALSAFDVAALWHGVKLTDAASELNAIHQLVDRVPLPMLGMAFIFWGGSYGRSPWGIVALKALSWAALWIGCAFVLIAPLAVSDGQRVRHEEGLRLQQEQQRFQQGWSQALAGLEAATTPEAFGAWFEATSRRTLPAASLADEATVERLRAEATRMMNESLARKNAEFAEKDQEGRWEARWKAARLGAGAALAGTVFLYLFWTTAWVRRTQLGFWDNLQTRWARWRARRDVRRRRGSAGCDSN